MKHPGWRILRLNLTTERVAVGGIALSLALLAWVIVVFGPSAPMGGTVSSTDFLLFVGVWGIGMVAMMLPSLLPMVFLVVSASKRKLAGEGDPGRTRSAVQPLAFVIGYFGIWSLVGVGAYLFLIFLAEYYPPFSSLGQLAGVAAGIAVFLAGVYQLSPLKQRALQECRSPMNFVMTKWRGGRGGGLLMGLDYGFFCTKCCWAFMGVLLVVGGMSLLWMVAFAGVIFVEKVAPPGIIISKGLGVLLMAAGVILAATPI